MTRPAAHERYDELAVGHALSALEPQDEESLLVHLPGCRLCAETIAETREMMSQLAYVPESDAPPPRLRTALLAGVAAEGDARMPRATLVRSGSSRRLPALRLGRFARWQPRLLVAAASALILLLVGWTAVLAMQGRESDRQTAQLQHVIREFEQPGSRTVPLAGPQGTVEAAAVLDGEDVSVVVDGLPPNDPTSTVYVLWAQRQGQRPAAVATFDVRSREPRVVVQAPLGVALSSDSSLAVTREQGRVAPPTPGPLLLSGHVS